MHPMPLQVINTFFNKLKKMLLTNTKIVININYHNEFSYIIMFLENFSNFTYINYFYFILLAVYTLVCEN
jgi:hypothetical protein